MKTVILAAGFGSRLWPLSTSKKPKQFQPLINNISLLAYTYSQLQKVIPTEELYVLILEGMQELTAQQLPNLDARNMIIVPERRNTFPHTLWALSKIASSEDESILFKSVDMFTLDEDAFLTSLAHVINNCREVTQLILLCAKYDNFNSNEGYCITDKTGKVLRFLEKPTEVLLRQLSEGHDSYRSPLLYITSKNVMRDALSRLSDEWLPIADALLNAEGEALIRAFLQLPFLDISTVIFQRSDKLQAAVIDYLFTDVGRFAEIYTLNPKDINGNVVIGDVILDGISWNNLIINKVSSPLVVISKSESVIVQTPEGTLVSSFAEANKIGEIYKQQIYKD